MRTDAVARAADVMIKYFGWRRNHTEGRATELTVKMLRAALKRDNLARQLFILDTDQPNTEFAGRMWDKTGDDSPVKRQYFKLADGLIDWTVGDMPGTSTPAQSEVSIHFDPPRTPPFQQLPPPPAAAAAIHRLIEQDRNRRHDPA